MNLTVLCISPLRHRFVNLALPVVVKKKTSPLAQPNTASKFGARVRLVQVYFSDMILNRDFY